MSNLQNNQTISDNDALKIKQLISDWQTRKLLPADIADTLLLDLQSNQAASPMHENRVISIFSTLGGVLIGLGILLFIAFNWHMLDATLRMLIIFSGLGLFHFGGFYFTQFEPKKIFAEIAYLLASFTMAGGIFLIAQTFHISGNTADAFLLIFLGTIPVAYVTRTVSVLWFGLIAGVVAYALKLSEYSIVSNFEMLATFSIGTVYYCLGYLHSYTKKFQDFTIPSMSLGASIMYISGIFMTLNISRYSSSENILTITQIILIFFPVIFGIVSMVFYILKRNQKTIDVILLLPIAYGLYILLTFVQIDSSDTKNIATSFLSNLPVICLLIFFMFDAIRSRSREMVNLSLLGTVIYIILRYVDTFAQYMGGSLSFIVAGILLLAGGYGLNRQRLKLYKQMENPEEIKNG